MIQSDPIAGLQGMVAISIEQVKAKAQNDAKLRPTKADVIKEFGAHRIEEKADGRWRLKADAHDKREMGKVNGLMREWSKAEVARIAGEQGFPGDYGKGGNGRAVLPVHIEDQFCPKCEMRWCWCECAGVGKEA